jgi:DtxR family Mn-dependent transcriptional regulator
VHYEPELLEQLQAAGLVPGAAGSFVSRGDYVLATVDGRDGDGLELPTEVAQHIYVGTARFAD